MIKRLFTLFILFGFIFIGFLHNSMMAFAMQNNMSEKMGIMQVDCNNSDGKKCHDSCHDIKIKDIIFFSNSNFSNKIIKVKLISFINIKIFESYFLENKNLIKNISPPGFKKEVKIYSYSDLVKIIKSNT